MKKLIRLILSLGLALGATACFAQSINNQYPSQVGAVDGTNVTAAKVIQLPQVQPTQQYNASPTPSPIAVTQTSQWYQLNGNGAIDVEFESNTFTGNYQVQLSDNPTPYSTPGNIYTVVQDTNTYATGGSGAQSKLWDYVIREGRKWIRFVVTPDVNNAGAGGTLNIFARLFGNPPAGDAARSYISGVPWKQSEQVANTVSMSSTPGIYNYEFKIPQAAHGVNVYTQTLGVSGASTITSTLYAKDPTTGQLQSIGVGTATHATGFTTIMVNPGYASPYPVATPPAGTNIISQPVPQDLVIGNVVTGAGSCTISQSAVPIQ